MRRLVVGILLVAALVVALATAGAALSVPTKVLLGHKGTYRSACSEATWDDCRVELRDARMRYIEAGGLLVIALIGVAGVVTLTNRPARNA